MKKREYVFLTICIVVLVMSVCGIEANGRTRNNLGDTTARYKEIEQEYSGSIKDKLEDMGYYNAGVSMTKIVNGDGSILYVVAVHHSKIDLLDEYQRDELSAIIVGDGIAVDNSSVRINYTEYMRG